MRVVCVGMRGVRTSSQLSSRQPIERLVEGFVEDEECVHRLDKEGPDGTDLHPREVVHLDRFGILVVVSRVRHEQSVTVSNSPSAVKGS